MEALPMIVQLDSKGCHFEGLINIADEHYQLQVSLSAPGQLDSATFRGDWKLWELLGDCRETLKQRLGQCDSVNAFIKEMKTLAEQQLRKKPIKAEVLYPPVYYSKLIKDIEDIGWNRLSYIDVSFSELHINTEDTKGRNHTLKLHFSDEYPTIAPTCTADVPWIFEFQWTKGSKLNDVLRQFSAFLELHQALWNTMDELYDRVWVIEPEHQSRKQTSCRIALGNNSSVQVTIDPHHPAAIPQCYFFGADHYIKPLKEKLNSNIEDWSPEESLLINLQTMLEITFPEKTTTNKEDFNMDCAICYCYNLNEMIPDIVCDDPRCNQPFHTACLYEWLKSISTSRQSFNTIFGECPHCSKPITCRMHAS